jgi:hypothetical protein
VALLLAASLALAESDSTGAGDFAFGRSLELQTDTPLQVSSIDLLVYRGSVEPRLADLRVFNAAGETVPHAIRSAPTAPAASDETRRAPLFRLPEPTRSDPAAGGDARVYAIDAELSQDGAIVRVRPAPGSESVGADASEPPSAYLIDLSRLFDSSGLARPVVGLELVLAPEPSQFVARIALEGSDDLVDFHAVPTRAALARLDQAGHRIERREVVLPDIRYRYLKLRGRSGRLPVAVQAVRARLAPAMPPRPRQAVRVEGVPVEGEAGAYRFDLAGRMPIDRLQVELPHDDTLVEARLYSADAPDGPWRREFAGVLYDLEFERERLRNDPVPWRVRRSRYVKLEVSGRGGGLGNGNPAIEASWHPEQLVFVTRGSAPFTLAYGRAGVVDASFDPAELLAATGRSGVGPLPDSAVLGAVRTVADPSVLRARREPTPPRTFVLWGVLVLCVGGALGLSVRLLRQMRSEAG